MASQSGIERLKADLRMCHALERAGYRVGLGSPMKLAHHYSEGSRIVYLTDRTSWRRKVAKGSLVLLARPP